MRALRRHDNVHHAIQLEMAKRVDVCIQLLKGNMQKSLTDRAIHEIRTRIKQLRTLLRLVRSDLQNGLYLRTKRCLQQTSRSLAPVRDIKVMLSTCSTKLLERDCADRARLRATLEARLERARRAISREKRRTLAVKLDNVRTALEDWPRSHPGWKSLSPGLRHLYDHGRAAYETASAKPSAANVRQLRKRAKDLLYACALLRKASAHTRALADDLDRFTELLGLDHDLAIVRRAVVCGELTSRGPVRKHLRASIAREHSALRRRAWRIGARIYDEPTARFIKRIHRDWKRWRR